MLVSDKIGALPIIGAVFNTTPFGAFTMTFLVDFGMICALMMTEGIPPWKRRQYKTFLWNDTVYIPVYMAAVVSVLGRAPPVDYFFVHAWWHWTALVLGFGISIMLEVGALKNGQYTMSQELSPSKLWHTFIFGVIFYWIIASLLPTALALDEIGTGIERLAFIVAVVGFFYNMYRDATLPFPPDAHLEGTWVPWHWYRRTY